MPQRPKTTKLALGLLPLLLAAPSSALDSSGPLAPRDEPVELPSGEARATTAADFRAQRARGSAFNEAWSYTFLFDDGTEAFLSLRRANFGSFMAPAVGAEFAVTDFGGEAYRIAKQYPAENLVSTPARLQIHPEVYAEGALPGRHRVYFARSKDGAEYVVDLELTDIAEGMTWGDGVFRLGDHEMGLFIHIPYARVAGTITINGEEKRVRGTAYMDHTYQTEFAPKLISHAFRYVHHGDEPEVALLISPRGGFEQRTLGFGLRREGGRFRLVRPSSIEVVSTRRALGVAVPRQVAVRFEGSDDPTILNREADRMQFSALEELGGLRKSLARRYIGGEVFGFRGRGETNRRRAFVYDFLVVD